MTHVECPDTPSARSVPQAHHKYIFSGRNNSSRSRKFARSRVAAPCSKRFLLCKRLSHFDSGQPSRFLQVPFRHFPLDHPFVPGPRALLSCMSEAPETILSASPVLLESTSILPSPSPVESETVSCLAPLRIAGDDASPRSEGLASSDETKSTDEASSGFEGPEKVRCVCFRGQFARERGVNASSSWSLRFFAHDAVGDDTLLISRSPFFLIAVLGFISFLVSIGGRCAL